MNTWQPVPSKAFRRRPLDLLRPVAALFALHLLAGGALAADPLTSTDRLRQFMAQVQPQPSASQAGGQAVREAAATSPEKLQERAELLKTGEIALARLDVNAALDAFERAALILHAADTEIALVRTYMQSGSYRRALAFGAHTAGAHLDVIGGSTLYAWLLHVGGQPALAQRLLTASETRMPGNLVVAAVQQQLRSGNPQATGQLLAPPTRLAPYGDAQGLPDTAGVVGSALLLPGGSSALLPLSLLPRSGKLWLRNGLGQLAKAKLDPQFNDLKVALVRLDGLLPPPENLLLAPADALAGSAGFAVGYVSTPDAAAAWPVLRSGLLGPAKGDSGEQLPGFERSAGPRGGLVFDGFGRLMGLALPGSSESAGAGGADNERLIPVSQLRKALAGAMASEQLSAQEAPGPAGPRTRGLVERIYENSLKSCLQVITAP